MSDNISRLQLMTHTKESFRLEIVRLEKENAQLKAEVAELKEQKRPIIHIGKDHSAYVKIKDLTDLIVLEPAEQDLPPLPPMILEAPKVCFNPRNRQERRHGRR